MSITNTIKRYLLRTSFAKILKNIQVRISYTRIPPLKSEIERKTVYCISPYKTGTTYLASCFSPEISHHEPLHHLTLKSLDKNFDSFFARRMKHLNLKLECSGFLSAYINELVENEIAKDLEYICILRSPSSWVTSVINYYYTRQIRLKLRFDYVNELFWKKKVGVDIVEFQIGVDTKKNQEIIDKILRFYIDFTNNTSLLKNVTYIKLKEMDNNLPYVESLIHETSTIKSRRKREGKHKPFVYKNKSIDLEYERLTAKLIKERNTSTFNTKF
jgi:hypothetical protein